MFNALIRHGVFAALALCPVSSAAIILTNTLTALPDCPLQTIADTPNLLQRQIDCPNKGIFGLASASISGNTFSVLAQAGSLSGPFNDPPFFVSFQTEAYLDQYFLVSGGTGAGTLVFDFTIACGGANLAVDVGRPLLRISNGVDTVQNPRAGESCLQPPSFGQPGSINIPFIFGTTPIRVEMDSFPVFMFQMFEFGGTQTHRMTAVVRILDSNGLEVTNGALLPIPEPSAGWLLGCASLIALGRGRLG